MTNIVKYISPLVKPRLKIISSEALRGSRYLVLMSSCKTLGERARRRRVELGLSVSDAMRRVRAAGRPQTTIQNIRQLEDGTVKKITYLAELSIALEADPIWLATGKEPEKAKPIIDETVLSTAWDAARVIIDEHGLDFTHEDQMILALRIYFEISEGDQAPTTAAKEVLLRMLASRQLKLKT